MKRKTICRVTAWLLALILLTPSGLRSRAGAYDGSVSASGAVLIVADTGAVLYEKDAHTRRSMASTTKIMTALLTLEEAAENGDREVEITEEMVLVEGSSMGLLAGDRLTLTGLATGMLLASGNDAANSAAIYLGGSQAGFADLMNARAAAIGMTDTHFVTPSGLDDEEHYSTAYDMALLAAEALKNDEFLRIASSTTLQVEFLQPEKRVSYTNHNKLLQLYDGCIGVKTGFTKKSGRCLVSAARRDGVTLICVTLNAPDDWNDHIALLDYGFSQVTSVSFDGSGFSVNIPVTGGDKAIVAAAGIQGGSVTVPADQADRIVSKAMVPRFLYAPVSAGQEIGRLQYYLDGEPIYSVPIRAAESVPAAEAEPGFWEKLFGWLQGNNRNKGT